ncbi:MAG: hypothetical protein GY917_31070 [Planctomycetaceae bacterium]|nr:hypothetical protein [Planctomycetaceae bacterium]
MMLILSWRHSALLLLCLFLVSSSTGCSVMMAARAPGKKNLAVLTPGVPRAKVIAELGAPLETSRDTEQKRDIFAFKQGYSTPTRVGRAGIHALADLATFGIWEVAGTPLEGALEGEDVRAEVRYDPQQYVQRVEYFSGAHLARGGPTLAPWLRSRATQQTGVVEATKEELSPVVNTDIQQPTAVKNSLLR